MANPKFKLYGEDGDGNVKLVTTESHPKTDASQEDMGKALTAAADLYDLGPSRIDLTSDTTVYTAA